MSGNKGGVGVRLDYHDTNFCFVTAHLAAGFGNYDERNRDYQTIVSGLRFPRDRKIEDHEVIIWAGDFNYRIGTMPEKARQLIEIYRSAGGHGAKAGPDLEGLGLQGLLAREGQELARQFGCPVDRVGDRVHVAAASLLRLRGSIAFAPRSCFTGIYRSDALVTKYFGRHSCSKRVASRARREQTVISRFSPGLHARR